MWDTNVGDEIGLEVPADTKVVVTHPSSNFLIEFRQTDEISVTSACTQNRVAVVVPVEDDTAAPTASSHAVE